MRAESSPATKSKMTDKSKNAFAILFMISRLLSQRLASAARRTQTSYVAEGSIKKMLSARRLQAFVMLERQLTDNHDDLALPHTARFSKEVFVNMRIHR